MGKSQDSQGIFVKAGIKKSVLDKFNNAYQSYPVSTLSYNISENCKWVFKIQLALFPTTNHS